MTAPAIVAAKIASWRAEIEHYLHAMGAVAEVLAAHADGHRKKYKVVVVAPENHAPEAVWGPAIAGVSEQDGIEVILTNIDFLPREQFEAHLSDADSIVMLVTTNSVAIECIDAIPRFQQKLLVCYPIEDMGEHAYSVLSQRRHNLEFLTFSRTNLESENACPLGTKIFARVADRVTVKSALEARRLRIQETLVVLVHGILSLGVWRDNIKRKLKGRELLAESTNAGLIQLPAFLLPFRWLRNKPVEKVWEDIRRIKAANPNCRISILAHSFGTFIVSRLFEHEDEFRVERIVFCGSIAPENYPLPVGTPRCASIINEVGSRDFWPALAHSITWGYGRSGTYGFQSPGIEDRWHRALGHGGFLTESFCEEFWIPYFEDGIIVPGDQAQLPSRFIRAVTLVPLKWVFVIVGVFWLAQRFLPL